MVSNCGLENKGYLATQDQGNLMFNETIMELVGPVLEKLACATCNDCSLFEDCKPKPIKVDGQFVGVHIDI